MENITRIWYGPLPADSPYLKPLRMYYEQNGMEKNWDLLKVHDSVAIIIFNKTRNTLVFVKQFRPGKSLSICFICKYITVCVVYIMKKIYCSCVLWYCNC